MALSEKAGEQKRVTEALRFVQQGQQISDLRYYLSSLSLLENYECYQPIAESLERNLSESDADSEVFAKFLARIYAKKLRRLDDAVRVLARLINQHEWGYLKISEFIQSEMVDREDYLTEAHILQGVEGIFPKLEDTVEALQRICLIFEKKTFNERLLARFYQKLREKNPGNRKALRYFKLVHSQQNQWHKVHEVLADMLRFAVHKNERAMVGLEKAALELYQLGRPEDTVATVKQHCSASFLDTSTVLYDAYSQLGRWDGCLEILRANLPKTANPFERSVIYFRMGHHQVSLERYDDACTSLKKSLEETPTFLDSLDALLQVALLRRDWLEVKRLLEVLKDHIESAALKDQIDEALSRLDEARSDTGAGASA